MQSHTELDALTAGLAELEKRDADKNGVIATLAKGVTGLVDLVKAQMTAPPADTEEPDAAAAAGQDEEPDPETEEEEDDDGPGYEDMLNKAVEEGAELDVSALVARLGDELRASKVARRNANKTIRRLEKATAAQGEQLAALTAALAGTLAPLAKAVGETHLAVGQFAGSPYREPVQAGRPNGVTPRRAAETQTADATLAALTPADLDQKLFKALTNEVITGLELNHLRRHRTLPADVPNAADKIAKIAAL